ncbi:MAG: CopD family protein [Cyclobacteriaceae bacterium]|jgi:putative membrane protein|nr:CopD family protein [Cyclobacteriaceae bacterium]
MTFLYLKAVHIVFIVTWFAGLFYMPRLMVYITEARDKPEPEKTILSRQLYTMARRLWYGITWPSAILTLGMGAALLIQEPAYLKMGFMHVKLAIVVLLYGYHFSLQYLMNRFAKGIVSYSSQQLRAWNEVPTLFLIAIVFIIVVRDGISIAWGLAGLLIVTIFILAGIRLYKKFRDD